MEALTASRATRAIARVAGLRTTPFLRCITVMEAASHLTYEGQDFQASVLLKQEWDRKHSDLDIMKFAEGLPFRDALLHTKWLRAIAATESIGLISNLKSVLGLASLAGGPFASDKEPRIFLPDGLRRVNRALDADTRALVVAPNRDLYVASPDRTAFVKSQGRWHYINYEHLQELMARHIPPSITEWLLQLLLNLSYERHGALLCIPTDPSDYNKLIDDHEKKGRSNEVLRAAVTQLDIGNESHRKILRACASVDGAIILSPEGKVMDVACMIRTPDDNDLATLGLHRSVFEGARSTAAWNASVRGVAVKVSEDGPISLFNRGKLVGQIG